ncbi:Xaa-Pro aminopeptidase [Mesorhizobium sp. J18]|uniref:M24 family metallopeptidase n=1 Tax=Mesorhizobium sp. J18 TaxID=935263 RepID=UPI00119A1B1C|nr:Xaa-Pro peptidase family protein [Mesorhizobium sp. J18]TWH01143.1 Xaa-Pro aminopeptidase [Mesorhizobium sp. J18]
MDSTANFGRHKRKIAPFETQETPWTPEEYEQLWMEARAKASAQNWHAIGYGDLAEGEWRQAGLADPDLPAMRKLRLERIRHELTRRDYAGILLYDPLNIRYAADHTNMQVWTAHNASRYLFVATEGPSVLFEFQNCFHLSDHTGMVDEVRPAKSMIYMFAGDDSVGAARDWAAEIADLATAHGGGNRRLAVDHLDPEPAAALSACGISIHNGEAVMERVRMIKTEHELRCMRRAIHSCERAVAEMEAALTPGISENELWAVLHRGNLVRGGEWAETRLLASGPRTNPWFQECSARIIENGDLVAFDTDLIGPYGYCCDISRTWLAGDGQPTNEQRDLYRIAADQIAYNTGLIKPGVTLLELSQTCRLPPPDCRPNRYGVLIHGVGLCDEYPSVYHPEDIDEHAPEEPLQPGMVLCVESYTGRLGGREGVKLEEQVLVTETGTEKLSSYPLDPRLS